jgi:hypothetical protein
VPAPNKNLVRVVVFTSVACAVAAAIVIPTPTKLPGAALGSVLVGRVEWAVAVFAALLLGTVVLVRAWQGVPPSEISGRGLKYADARQDRAEGQRIRRRDRGAQSPGRRAVARAAGAADVG